MDELTKEVCDKTRKALCSYVDYVQSKIDNCADEALKTGNTPSDMALCECVRTLNHVSGILSRLKEVESDKETPMTVHNNYVTNY